MPCSGTLISSDTEPSVSRDTPRTDSAAICDARINCWI